MRSLFYTLSQKQGAVGLMFQHILEKYPTGDETSRDKLKKKFQVKEVQFGADVSYIIHVLFDDVFYR